MAPKEVEGDRRWTPFWTADNGQNGRKRESRAQSCAAFGPSIAAADTMSTFVVDGIVPKEKGAREARAESV